MTSKEALNLLSIMKLGIDLGAFPEDRRLPIDETVHRDAAGPFAKELATEVERGGARPFARRNHPRAFASVP